MAKRELTNLEKDALVSAVMNSMMLMENMDVLKDTDFYKSNIKKFGNGLINCIMPLINQNKTFQQKNARTANNLFIDNVGFREKIVKLNVAEQAEINQIHDYYKDNPKQWESFYQFKELKTESNVL